MGSSAVVSIEEACGIVGERPRYRCPECDKELLARCGTKRSEHFAHRYPGTTCLGRRLPPAPSETSVSAAPEDTAPGWAPPEDPVAAAAAAAALEAERAELTAPLRLTPTSPEQRWTAAPPPASPRTDRPVDEPHVCFVDLYFPDKRLLQLIMLFVPNMDGEGGRLTMHVEHPGEDKHHLEGTVLGEWSTPVARQRLHESLEC
jgi:hypothetical protein